METVAVNALPGYLRQRGAQFMRDRSSSNAHIYYSRPLNRWLKVQRKGAAAVVVTYHATCPCSGG